MAKSKMKRTRKPRDSESNSVEASLSFPTASSLDKVRNSKKELSSWRKHHHDDDHADATAGGGETPPPFKAAPSVTSSSSSCNGEKNEAKKNDSPSFKSNGNTKEALSNLLKILSSPQDLIRALPRRHEPFNNDNDKLSASSSTVDDNIVTQQKLMSISSVLFEELEHLASLLISRTFKNKKREFYDNNNNYCYYKHGEEEKDKNDNNEEEEEEKFPLSGLTELYTGIGDGDDDDDGDDEGQYGKMTMTTRMVDSETLWGQVDLQNASLLDSYPSSAAAASSSVADKSNTMGLLPKAIQRLTKKLRKHEKKNGDDDDDDDNYDKKKKGLIRLLDLDGLSDDDEEEEEEEEGKKVRKKSIEVDEDEDEDEDEENDDKAKNLESEEEEEEDDEEARRIRERMERAMADADDDDDDLDDGSEEEDEESIDKKEHATDDKKDNEDEELIDPAAEELNDGFFDINEMEEFADEEEAYLPDEAYGQEVQEDEDQSEMKEKKKKKLLHQKHREGAESDSEDDEEDENDGLTKRKENFVHRRKYREDDEIDALFSLYEEPNEDEVDDVVNMTAADFFGTPNKRYLKQYESRKTRTGTGGNGLKDGVDLKMKAVEDNDDAESWDNHDFAKDGHDWRYDNSDDEDANDGKEDESESEGDKGENEDEEANDGQDADGEDGSPSGLQKNTTNHTKKSKKLIAQTLELEREILAEKPWQMSGETKSTSRPVNSLLESTPEFSVASKMAPVITVEHTTNLEEIIKRRIIAEDWDDVIPRELPDIGLKKRNGELPEVSQEKSKLGLGELYEREYLKKAVGYDVDKAEKETEEEKARKEMRALFASLCSKLDALSNYHFCPRPVADEAEVRPVTTPAIAMEEVLPLHVSDARAVAPEEVYGAKKGRDAVLRGASELDQAERKRLRNAKKAARRKARKEKLADEKLISRLQPGLGLNNPYEKRKLREELSMARARGKVAEGEIDSNTEFKTSEKFFKRMQEEVEREVHGDGETFSGKRKKRKLDENGQKSSSLML